MRNYTFFALFVMLAATAAEGLGACHAVGPSATGDGSGSNWSNRMNKLPANLVRGDTYYLMDGSYGSYGFTTANSGSLVITVKKAQPYDYGRIADGCSNDISSGWTVSSMGSGQAQFSNLSTGAKGVSYFTIDGNGRSANSCGTSPVANAAASDCGIKVTSGTGDYGPFMIGAYTGFTSRTNNWTIRYVEWQGGGDGNTVEQNGIWCHDGCDNLLIEHVWWYNSGTDFIKIPASAGATIRNSHFKQNNSTSSYHGQFYLDEGNTSNVNFYDNIIQDIQGTGIWVVVSGAQASNYNIYNNVLVRTQGSSRPGTSNGIFACINAGTGTKCSNMKFIGNSVVNYTADYQGALGILDQNGGGSYVWQNNLFYNISPSDRIGFNLDGSTLTEDHNSWLNSGSPISGSGDKTVTTGAPNPFVNWPNSDFRLGSQNADWEAGATLASPFNVDFLGNPRPGGDGLWDRGAFEYGAQAPAPPSRLSLVIH